MIHLPPADDSRFHFDIWRGPTNKEADTAAIYYVENHNAQPGYSQLAIGFKDAADLAIAEYEKTLLGNWIGPIAHLIRQTMELELKALLKASVLRGNEAGAKILRSHNLSNIWESSIGWLINHGYKTVEDARIDDAMQLSVNLHEVDPSGDLFRFGVSGRTAFGKNKSYDRVGLRLPKLKEQFGSAVDFLDHWMAVLMREVLAKNMGWDKDPYFDPDKFPRRPMSRSR